MAINVPQTWGSRRTQWGMADSFKLQSFLLLADQNIMSLLCQSRGSDGWAGDSPKSLVSGKGGIV